MCLGVHRPRHSVEIKLKLIFLLSHRIAYFLGKFESHLILMDKHRFVVRNIHTALCHIGHTRGAKALAKGKAIAEKSVYVIFTYLFYFLKKMRSVRSVVAHNPKKVIFFIVLIYSSISVHLQPAAIIRRNFVVNSNVYVSGNAYVSLVAGVYHLAERITVAKTRVFLSDFSIIVAEAHITASREIDVFYVRADKLLGEFLCVKITEYIFNSRGSVKIKMKCPVQLFSNGLYHKNTSVFLYSTKNLF